MAVFDRFTTILIPESLRKRMIVVGCCIFYNFSPKLAFVFGITYLTKKPDPGDKNHQDIPKVEITEKSLIPGIFHQSWGFRENFGDKNPEIKKNTESRGLKSLSGAGVGSGTGTGIDFWTRDWDRD